MFEKIMVPTDGSEYAARAEDMAIELAGRLGSVVIAVHVIDEKLIYPLMSLRRRVRKYWRLFRGRGVRQVSGLTRSLSSGALPMT